jgi:hypothetical protein
MIEALDELFSGKSSSLIQKSAEPQQQGQLDLW